MKKFSANRTSPFIKGGLRGISFALLCAFILLTGNAQAKTPPAALVAQTASLAPNASILIPIKDLIINPGTLNPDKILSGNVNHVSFSPDGQTLVCWGDSAILYDIATGAKIKTFEGRHFISSVSFSPDGKTLASGGDDKSIIFWDIATGSQLKTLEGHSARITFVAFSPDGKTLASGGDDKSIILWDIATGAKIKTLDHSSPFFSVSFSPDGKTLASGSYDENVILWDIATGGKLKTLEGHSIVVWSVSFSPDGKTLAAGNYESVILWDIATGTKLKTLGYPNSVLSVSFSPDGKTLATGSRDRNVILANGDHEKNVILWNVATGAMIKTFAGYSDTVHSVSFSPDGKTLASGGWDNNSVILRDVRDVTTANIAKLFEKDEFETAREHEARVGKIEVPYSEPITFGRYDADRGGFEAELNGNKLFIPVAKEKAREVSGKSLRVEGKLKYHDPENMALVEANVMDGASNERFALYKMTEGAAVASTPKPASKPAQQTQASYAPVPSFAGTFTSDIDAIPDFKVNPRPNDIAIVIGIENYQSVPKSDFSKSDAMLVKAYLKAMGFQERNIASLTDEEASYVGIKKTIETWLPNRIKNDSKVFVYYSGHGAPEPATGEAYIVPFDGDPNYLSDTAYPIKRLYEKLGKLKAAEVVVALDSCFSGAGGRSVLAKGARPLVMMMDVAAPSSNMAILTATNGPQISTSSPDKGHGVFTYYFLKALKDGKGTVADVYEYMKPLVEDEAKQLNVQQSPGISPAAKNIKGRFSLNK